MPPKMEDAIGACVWGTNTLVQESIGNFFGRLDIQKDEVKLRYCTSYSQARKGFCETLCPMLNPKQMHISL